MPGGEPASVEIFLKFEVSAVKPKITEIEEKIKSALRDPLLCFVVRGVGGRGTIYQTPPIVLGCAIQFFVYHHRYKTRTQILCHQGI